MPSMIVRAALVRIVIEGEGQPEIHRVAVGDRVESVAGVPGAGRHHADYGEGLRVERNGAADDCGVGRKAAAPEAVAQDGEAAASGQFVVGSELAASRRSQAEHAEVSGGDPERMQHDGLAHARELRIVTG